MYNCCQSHKGIVEYAKKRNWDFVCVFEDDAWPINGVVDHLKDLLSDVPDCDSLVLGNSCNWKKDGESDQFIEGFVGYGTHAYIVFKGGYGRFLDTFDKYHVSDAPFWAINNTCIDRGRILASKRNLFIQYNQVGTSMSNQHGFTWYTTFQYIDGVVHLDPKKDNITPEEVFKLGFPRPEEVGLVD